MPGVGVAFFALDEEIMTSTGTEMGVFGGSPVAGSASSAAGWLSDGMFDKGIGDVNAGGVVAM